MLQRLGQIAGVLLMAAIVLGLGAIVVWVGLRAIRTQTFEMSFSSNSSLSIGPFGHNLGRQTTVNHYDGADAVRVGVGIAAIGAMIGLWALALGSLSFTDGLEPRRPGVHWLAAAMCLLLLICQTVAMICCFPPWRLQNMPVALTLYPTLAALALMILCRPLHAKPRQVLSTLIFASIVTFYFSRRAALGFMLAAVLVVFFVIHILFLWRALFGRPLRPPAG